MSTIIQIPAIWPKEAPLRGLAAKLALLSSFVLLSPSAQATDQATARASIVGKAMLASAQRVAGKPVRSVSGTRGNETFDPANYFDNKELIRAPRAIHALDSSPFGEQVNLYRGSLEFVQTDVSLEGSSKLPVAVTRKLSTGGMGNLAGGLFSEWDLEIPHIYGTFLSSTGWVKAVGASVSNQRCSNFGAPPDVPYATNRPGWRSIEFWRGNMLSVPGAGSQEILRRGAGNNNVPADGRSYPLVTVGNWAIECLESLASTDGSTPYAEQGQGFLARSPDGTKYRFDWLVSRSASAVTKKANVGGAHISASRTEVWLLPTVVTDRFGNTVTYSYDTADKWKLLQIAASDGRRLTFSYVPGTRRIQSVTDGLRTWTYTYQPAPGNGRLAYQQLVHVTLPDGSAWDFRGMSVPNGYADTNSGIVFMEMELEPPAPESPVTECDTGIYASSGGITSPPATGWMVHPSGAVGSYTLMAMEHGRNGVPQSCYSDGIANSVGKAMASRFDARFSLTARTLTGPGLPGMRWSYSYDTWYPGWDDGSAWTGQPAIVSVTDPEANLTRHTFGNRFNVDEGKPLKVEVLQGDTTVLRTTFTQYETAQFAHPVGVSDQRSGDGLLNARIMPVKQRTILQQGVEFIWRADSFDGLGRPLDITKRSSLPYSRSENTTYYDERVAWVLGQIDTVTSGGLAVVHHEYEPGSAALASTTRFGILQASFGYNGDGTLASRTDGRGYVTYLDDYKLGIPRSVRLPTGARHGAVVNDIGLITNVTDEVGYTTEYGYDAMGRLASIKPPGAFTATNLSFERIGEPKFGLETGHWRQSVSLGNARTETYFDALWRPVMTRIYDNADEAETRKVVVKAYDFEGRTRFESYPRRDLSSIWVTSPGKRTGYDALGRITQVDADSELGVLTTSKRYGAGFTTSEVNPRQYETVHGYWALDQPEEALVQSIRAPEGVQVSFSRDAFGKAQSISRGGVTRSYVYDAGQRLCKTVEPETGASLRHYDEAGNLDWSASGQNLPGTTACDDDQVAEAAKIRHDHDELNRLTRTRFGDGSAEVKRSYTADGLLEQISSDVLTWTYGYNELRLPTTQQYTWWAGARPEQGWQFGWGYDGNGNKLSLSDPWGTMYYAPNALGQATQVSGYARDVKHHPDGAVASYTLDNGVRHVHEQNTRGLPLRWKYLGVVDYEYHYDQNGNVEWIGDWQQGQNRQMGYDGLDRLTSASGPWGAAIYEYDAADNLRSSTVGGRSLVHHYDGRNRLSALSGSLNLGIGYDANGNVIQRGEQFFSFDIGNRMGSAPGKVLQRKYDGHGRRGIDWHTDGAWNLYAYGHEGKLLFSYHNVRGHTRYVYLGGRVISETAETATTYSLTDVLGSPVAKTSAIGTLLSRTHYEPYGATASGVNPSGIGFTGHVNDAGTGLVYMQQRYYDPVAGRFLSVDPVVTDEHTGGHFNRYSYADNDPYGQVDPNGRAPIAPRHPDPVLQRALAVGNAINTIARIAASKSSSQANGLSQNAASREAKREAGIPTSQQPAGQTNGKVTDPVTGEQVSVGRQQTYLVPKPGGGTETMSVQVSRDVQGAHKGATQIEAGKVKPGGQTDAAGRPRIQNEGKVRVDFNPEKR